MNKVLIVEDDVFVSRMYSRAFTTAGFEVETASNGEDALVKLSQNSLPAVVIMDVMMPKMGGADLLRNIKKDARLEKVATAILTNSFVSEDEKRFMQLGADLYLIKIENLPQTVVSKIQNLIQKKAITINKI